MRFFKKEKRAEQPTTFSTDSDAALLQAIFGRSTITKSEALNIPSIQACINYVSGMVAMLPIKLYRESDGKTEEVKDDNRIKLLNDDTGDTMDATQFWQALLVDYFLGKGGYAYIKRAKNEIVSLHYVDEAAVSINTNCDPIFKDYELMVNGESYKPFDFLKLLRHTKNGAEGKSIINESPLILGVMYHSLMFEQTLVRKGGNKKGFIKAKSKLNDEAMAHLKAAWNRLYSNENENVVILNDGLEFQEASESSVEMQLNENKNTNAAEMCKIFNIAINVINGTASPAEYASAFKTGVMPVLRVIECALNKDLLLEREKGLFYYAFDTKEMLKGDLKSRYEAYKIGLDSNFLRHDEVRYMEDLPPLGLDWLKMDLGSVFYDLKTKTIYTPNTNAISKMTGGEKFEDRDTE